MFNFVISRDGDYYIINGYMPDGYPIIGMGSTAKEAYKWYRSNYRRMSVRREFA